MAVWAGNRHVAANLATFRSPKRTGWYGQGMLLASLHPGQSWLDSNLIKGRWHEHQTRHPACAQWLADKALIEGAHQVEAADQLTPIASELGCSLAQLALAWCAKNPNVSSVITGSTKVAQVCSSASGVFITWPLFFMFLRLLR